MGVKGLWPVIEMTKENVLLDGLKGQIVAVDSSIWIYQFLKARSQVEHAALQGFLSRIIKLLIFGIKPVFVFDGPAPMLKRKTIRGRQQRRSQKNDLQLETEMELFSKRIKLHALDHDVLNESYTQLDDDVAASIKSNTRLDNDASIPPHTRLDATASFGSADPVTFVIPRNDPRFATTFEIESLVNAHYDKNEDISENDVKKLDVLMKYREILDRKNQSRHPLESGNLERIARENPKEFSLLQIENLVHRNQMTYEYSDFTKNAGLVANPVKKRFQSSRIVADRDRSYILLEKDSHAPGFKMSMTTEVVDLINEAPKKIPLKLATQDDIFDYLDQMSYSSDASDEDEEFIQVGSPTKEDCPLQDDPLLFHPDPQLIVPITSNISTMDYVSDSEDIATLMKRFEAVDATRMAHHDERESKRMGSPDANSQIFIEEAASSNASLDQLILDVDDTLSRIRKFNASDIGTLKNVSSASIHNVLQNNRDSQPNSIAARHIIEPEESIDSIMRKFAQMEESNELIFPILPALMDESQSMSIDSLNLDAAVNDRHDEIVDNSIPFGNKDESVSSPLPDVSADDVSMKEPSIIGDSVEEGTVTDYVAESKLDFGPSLTPHEIDDAFIADALQRFQDMVPSSSKPISMIPSKTLDAIKHIPEFIPSINKSIPMDRAQLLLYWENSVFDPTLTPHIVAACEISDFALEEIYTQTMRRMSKTALSLAHRQSLKELEVLVNAYFTLIQSRKMQSRLVASRSFIPAVSLGLEYRILDYQLDFDQTDDKPDHIIPIATEAKEIQTIASSDDGLVGNDVTMVLSSDEEATFSANVINTPPNVDSNIQMPIAFEDDDDDIIQQGNATANNDFDTSSGASASEFVTRKASAIIPCMDDITVKGVDKVSDLDEEDELSDYERMNPHPQQLLAQSDGSEPDLAFNPSSSQFPKAPSPKRFDAESRKIMRDDLDQEINSLKLKRSAEHRDASQVTDDMIRECQELLRLFGIPFMTAAGEAEAQCAFFASHGHADAVITDDSDIFLFGNSTSVYKNVFNKAKYVEKYSNASINRNLKLDREKMVLLAMLLGSDYTDGINGVGAVNGMEVLEQWGGTFEGLCAFRAYWDEVQANPDQKAKIGFAKNKRLCKRIQIPLSFPDRRVYDAYFQPSVYEKTPAFVWLEPDLQAIRDYLEDTLEWGKSKCDSVLSPLEKKFQAMKDGGSKAAMQTTLDGFILKTISPPKNPRIAAVVDKWKVTQVSEKDVKINPAHIRLPVSRKKTTAKTGNGRGGSKGKL